MAALQTISSLHLSARATVPSRSSTLPLVCDASRTSFASRTSQFACRSVTHRALGRAAGSKRASMTASSQSASAKFPNPFDKSGGDSADGYPTGKLTMFTSPGSRAQIIEWYAMEKGIEMESVSVDMRSGAHKRAPFTNVHPFGKMPAIQAADGTPIFESGAILLYLAALAGELNTPEEIGTAAKWTLYANATYWSSVEKARGGPPDQLKVLDGILSERAFLLGDNFSVSDVALGSYLYYTKAFFGEKFGAFPNVQRYLKSLMDMPSFRATCGSS